MNKHKLVASCITITTRDAFYLWLETLPWNFIPGEMKDLADKAKPFKTAVWSCRTGFRFW